MSNNRSSRLLSESSAGLVVVDIQERFRGVILDFPAMLEASIRMVRAFQLLSRPIVLTEQYPRGLGSTVPELSTVLSGIEATQKMTFSCGGCESVDALLEESSCRQVVVCGIEAHVCVQQSVLDLLERGAAVFVPVDAISSRKALDREWALRRLADAGATLSTSESLAFELLENASHPQFKAVQALFK